MEILKYNVLFFSIVNTLYTEKHILDDIFIRHKPVGFQGTSNRVLDLHIFWWYFNTSEIIQVLKN